MNPKMAAEALLRRLELPRRSASVWVWREGADVRLIVRLDPDLMSRRPDVPRSFRGYRVEVVEKDVKDVHQPAAN